MIKVIRKEITIEIENDNDIEKAQKEKLRYKNMGYIVFEENEQWIQLDRFLRK